MLRILFSLPIRRAPRSTLFPYTTLFRSFIDARQVLDDVGEIALQVQSQGEEVGNHHHARGDRKSTRLNSSHANISYAVFCLKKKNRKPAYLRSRTES